MPTDRVVYSVVIVVLNVISYNSRTRPDDPIAVVWLRRAR